MVYITHSGENVDKLNNILTVAQKRFGLYGLEKTTMKEIASDLRISKASLYYYFPDKEHLFKAVVEMEQEVFFSLVEATIQANADPAIMLKEFVKIRLDHFKTFFNLSRLRFEEFRFVKSMLSEAFAKFSVRETEIVQRMLARGIELGQFQINDSYDVASLFLEVIGGVRNLAMHNKELLYVEQEEYDLLTKKLNAITDIFIRGLMCNKAL